MGLRGSVKAFSLDQLFEFLHASGHRGTLRVSQKTTAKKTLYLYQGGIYVERGEWTFRLGDALVRRATITREQLEAALARQKTTGLRLGDTLVELGFTTNEHVLAARRLQVEEEIYDLFAWDDAVYEFDKDVLPEGFDERLKDPEEFRFDVRSILMEAARRLDEWKRIHENVPSLKRLYVLSDKPQQDVSASTSGAVAAPYKGIIKAFKETKVAQGPECFDGKRTVEEFVRLFGLSHFETLSLMARFCSMGLLRPLQRHELEARLRVAVEEDLPYALKLYESALETPEFEARAKYLDRAVFGSVKLREYAQKASIVLAARMRGKRALELLLSLLRQGITCELQATEEGRTLGLGFSKSALVWRGKDRENQPNIVKHLLARSPIAAADMARVEEMKKTTGRTLQQILVGGGYVTMDNWFRAQKDTVLNEIFDLFFWKRPYIEVRTGSDRDRAGRVGLDIDVPMLPWLREEVSEEIKRWEAIVAAIPSVRGFYVLSPKGAKQVKGTFDMLNLFDGKRPLEEIMKGQKEAPHQFFFWLHEQITSGRIEPLTEDDYRKRLDAALQVGRRREAIEFCVGAVESGVQIQYFQDRLRELEAAEAALAAEGAARPTLRGDLASFSLAEVLQSFYMGKRSGTLKIFDDRRAREIYFNAGAVHLLLDGAETAEHAMRDGAQTPIPAGLSGGSLADTLSEQMKDELYEVFLWDKATFEFTADVLPSVFYNEGLAPWRVKLNTSQFLMEAVRRIAEWEEVRAVLPHDDLKLVFISGEAKMSSIQSRGQPDLLLLVDGNHTISDAIRMSGAKRFQSLCCLAELLREGAIARTDGEARPAEGSSQTNSGLVEDGSLLDALKRLRNETATGITRVTDGRRSKELAFVEGVPHRTSPWRGTHDEEAATRDTAHEFAEALSWKGARWEFLDGTLPPVLHAGDEAARAPYRLDPDGTVEWIAVAGQRWNEIGAEVPRDKSLALVDDDVARSRAADAAREAPQVLELIDGKRQADDIARLAGKRYEALSAILSLIRVEAVVAVDPPQAEEQTEEEWDLSLG